MRYLTAGDVVRVNEHFCGPEMPVDFGLLESATSQPMQSAGGIDAYPDVHTKAAALFRSLVRNHPFLDGNKRTAVAAVNIFYGLNGWELLARDDEVVAIALDVATGQLDVAAIAGFLKGWAGALPPPGHEPEMP